MARKEPTDAQKQAAEARRERFRELAHKVGEMNPEQRAALAERMGAVATVEGHTVSLQNTILLSLQSPEPPTLVAGLRQWLAARRVVKKGEHGLMMWAPRTPSKGEQDAPPGMLNERGATPERQRFIMVTVFDVSQTTALEATAAA